MTLRWVAFNFFSRLVLNERQGKDGNGCELNERIAVVPNAYGGLKCLKAFGRKQS